MTAPDPAAPIARPRRRRLLAFAKVVVTVVWALLFFELFVRVFRPVALMPRHVGGSSFGIRANMPNRSYWQRTQDVSVNIRINSKGIRADGEIPYAKPPGTRRIVALGDSYMMGFEVDLEQTFLARMERELEAAGLRVEVVNLAVSGLGNAEELVMLREEGLKYDPDLVLLEWHDSDLDDNVRSNLFALVDSQLVPRNREYLPGVEIAEKLGRIPLYGWLDENSQGWSLAREKAVVFVKDLITALHGSTADPRARERAKGSAAEQDPSYNERLSIALLHRIRTESEAHGARFLAFDVPRRFSRTELKSYFPWQRAAGLDVVDPLPVFQQHSGELLYWERGQSHLTPLGCELVGHLLARHILDRGLLSR